MTTFNNIVKTRISIEHSVVSVLSTYVGKYVRKLFFNLPPSKMLYTNFQKTLVEVAEWDDKRKLKEYKKFSRWCETKKDITAFDLEKNFHQLIVLYIQMMLHKYRDGYESVKKDYVFPSLQSLFYKTLKKAARYFYENPKVTRDDKTIFETITRDVIEKYMPLTEVLNYISSVDETTSSVVEYNFDKSVSSEKRSRTKSHVSGADKLIIEKEPSCKSGLRYISSDEFNNEYYQSESDKERELHEQVGESADEEVRHIRLPKLKKPYNKYNPTVENEKQPRDNLFSD
jgi:hypothetical protein